MAGMKTYLKELNGIMSSSENGQDSEILKESIKMITSKIEQEAKANTGLIKGLLAKHLPVFKSGITSWKISISQSDTGMDCEVVENGTNGATVIATADETRKTLENEGR